MKSIFKKIAFVLALAMVVTAFPAKTAAAADEPTLKAKRTLYIGGDATEQYAESAWASVKKGDYTVAFASKDEKIVTVNAKNGRLHAVSVGETVVTATFSKDGEKEIVKECAVKVKQNAGAVTLEETSAEMYVGDKITIKATPENENTTDKIHFAPKADADKEIIDVDYDNGEITAKAEGTATVLVYATQWEYNKDTKKWAKKVTTEKVEFAVTVKKAGFAAAKQVKANTVAITCETEELAAAIAKNASKIKATYVLGDNEIDAYINTVTVDADDKKVINVALYSNLTKEKTYVFRYEDQSVEVIGTDLNAIADIKITTTSVYEQNLTTIKVSAFNKEGIEVNSDLAGVQFTADVSTDYYVSGNQIFFYSADKTANITAKYNMGFDSNGNKITDLVATGVIISKSTASAYGNATVWTAGADDDNSYNTNVIKLAANDPAKQLYFKYVKTAYNGAPSTIKFNGVADSEGNTYTYQSTNPAVILVDATGMVTPVSAGNAQVIVTRDRNNVKSTFAVVSFAVDNKRTLANLDIAVTKSTLSTSTDDELYLKVGIYDQLGADFSTGNIKIEVSVLDGAAALTCSGSALSTTAQVFGAPAWNGAVNANAYTIKATGVANAYIANNAMVQVKVTDLNTYQSITKVATFAVRQAGTEASYQIIPDKTNIDLNFANAAWYQTSTDAYTSTISVKSYDNAGSLVKNETGIQCVSVAAIKAPVSGSAYSLGDLVYTVEKGTDDKFSLISADKLVAATVGAGTITATPYVAGTYVVRLYKVVTGSGTTLVYRNVANNSIAITDSSATVTAKAQSTTITAAGTTTTIAAAFQASNVFKFYRNGADISSAITITDIEQKYVSGNYVVTALKVTEHNNTTNLNYNYTVYIDATVFPNVTP